jgi:hypothetical protein
MPTINRAFRDFFLISDGDQVGVKKRIDDRSNFHPMVRDAFGWDTLDQIRGVLGEYKTLYAGSKGVQLLNYSSLLKSLRSGSMPGAWDRTSWLGTGIGRINKQLKGPNGGTNIIFDYEIVTGPYGPPLPVADADPDCLSQTQIDQILDMGGSVPQGRGCAGTTHAPVFSVQEAAPAASAGPYEQEFLKLTYNVQEQAAWNGYSARTNASTNFLSNVPTMTSFLSGNYFIGSTQYPGLLNSLIGVPRQDHTAIIFAASPNIDTRATSGYNLHAEPVYNYYASTTPPYEVVIGLPGNTRAAPTAPSIKEYHLPNVYYLQSELNNTSSVLLAQYHLPSLTLEQNIPWFNIGNQQNVTEANVDRYYDLYAEGITALKGDSVLYGAVDASLNLNNRNFVILHSDLDALKEDRINTTTIPFYNKLILGYDIDGRTGHKANISILRNLYNDDETRDFVNILQMQTVLRLTTETGEAQSLGVAMTQKTVSNSELPVAYGYSTTVPGLTSLYDLEEIFENYLSTTREVEIASIINNFATFNPNAQYIGIDLAQLPFRLIRDYNLSPDQLDADPVHVENAYIDLYENRNAPANLSRVMRSYKEVLDGVSCHTETLMYIVKKKLSPDADPIQTFYISAQFSNDTPTVFYDTQVKYETDYYYEIDRVVLVFGNEYEYLDDLTVTGGGDILGLPIVSKIPIENRPNIKALVVPYITSQGNLTAKIMDKPPVPPEITFHPYKGVNNKLKILLNSSTGKVDAAPVVIEEGDEEYFLGEYRSQGADWSYGYQEMIDAGRKLTFRSDDPVDAYEIFRLAEKPDSYQSFAGNGLLIDPPRGVPGAILDTVGPNTKYYYCARSIDVHGNRSNPTHIYELEIVDNNGQIFLKQGVIRYEAPKQNFIKEGRRFMYIEPAYQQIVMPPGTDTGPPAVDTPPLSGILGDPDIDKVWGKTFKVRVKSKQTGRKVDLNLTFKNTGIVNASE